MVNLSTDCYIQGELWGMNLHSVGLYLVHTDTIYQLVNNHGPVSPECPLWSCHPDPYFEPLRPPPRSRTKGLRPGPVLQRQSLVSLPLPLPTSFKIWLSLWSAWTRIAGLHEQLRGSDMGIFYSYGFPLIATRFRGAWEEWEQTAQETQHVFY